MNYLLHILILVNIYVVLVVSLNLLTGYTGLLSICHAAFYGVGAYTTALLSLKVGWPWLGTVVAGMFISGVMAAIIGTVSVRFRGDYFAIVTFTFQVILFGLMQNWTELTKGPRGLPGVPSPRFFGWEVSSHWDFFFLSIGFAILVFMVVRRLGRSPYGRVLRAIREDEAYAQSLGKNVDSYKASAFIIGAMLAAIAGSIYASFIAFVDPTAFTVDESIFILAILIVGGAGSLKGAIVSTAFLVAMPEMLRFLGVPSSIAANLRQILYGILLLLCLYWRPQGLKGEYAFGKEISQQ